MAVALKCKYFKSATDVTKFCQTVGNNVTTVVAIHWDTTTSQYVLFYT